MDYLLGVTMVRIGHGRIRDATLAAREALEETQRLGVDATKAHTQLGLALTLLGRYEEARVELETALEGIDMQHPDAVLVLGVSGIQRGFVGEDREAIESFERALALEGERKLGQPHYRALVGTYMAISVDRLGNAEKAIFMQRTAIAALKQLWGEEHGALGRAYHQFGTTLADNGKWAEARDAFERSLAIWKRTHGSNHRAVAHPETGLARVLLHEGRNVEALRLLESALPKLAAEDGHPPEDSRTYFHLARALALTDGDQMRARQLAATALELLADLGPGYDRDRQAIKTWQAEHSTPRPTL